MQAVLLAGGLGTRLRPLTETLPKALVPVAGRPFIEYQIEQFRRHDVSDLIICLGHLGHMIEEHLGNGSRLGVSIRYGYEHDRLLGTAGAIRNVESLLEPAFFVQYGDSYLLVDYPDVMQFFNKHDAPGLMVVYKNNNRWERSNVIVEDDHVRVYDKAQSSPEMVYVDFGVSVFLKDAFKGIPAQTETDLSTVYRSLIRKDQLLAYETHQRFYEVGSPPGLREFESLVYSGLVT